MLPNLSALDTHALVSRASDDGDGLVVYGNVERWLQLSQEPPSRSTQWPYRGGLFIVEDLVDFFDNPPYVMEQIESAINGGALKNDASKSDQIKVDTLDVKADVPESNGLSLGITFSNVRAFVKAIDPTRYITSSTAVDAEKRPWLASVVNRLMPAAESLTNWLTDRTLDVLLGAADRDGGVFNVTVRVSLDITKTDGSKSLLLRLQGIGSETNNLLLTMVGFLAKFAFPIAILSRDDGLENDSLIFKKS